jgi:hypothetical protein
MNSRFAKTMLTITAAALVALPGVAQARQGADDPAGHVRHAATEVHHHNNGTAGRHGADDAPGQGGGHGADDTPGHR